MAWANTQDARALWDAFLAAWPLERVRTMTLDEYFNNERQDAFCYWLEFRLRNLGSISGNAFMFGVYRRADKTTRATGRGRSYAGDYAWQTRYGATAEEAFRTIRRRLIRVIEAAVAGDLDLIEATDVGWPIVKWKVAFLYQDRASPRIFPVFRDDRLLHHYRLVVPSARHREVSRAVMYPTLLDRYRALGDVFDVARHIWSDDALPATARYWAVPLHLALPKRDDALAFCALTDVTPDDVNDPLDALLADAEVGVGDRLALLVGDTVRALGDVESAEPGVYAWAQRAVEITPDLVVVPAKVVELDAAERASIWQVAPDVTPTPVVSDPSPPAGPCPEPQSLLLFGPPGTGKTWSTVERALQLILGPAAVAPMGADTRARQFRQLQRDGQIEFVTFHQAYGYEEFVEGIRPVLGQDATAEVRYEVHAGAFKRIALRAMAEGLRGERPPQESERERMARVQEALDRPQAGTVDFQFTDRTRPHVLIIDEINRGNISKILGELITLLEPDKRLGAANELKLPLAYSPQHRFAVPPNLHVIGTMNTADRSIALMDVALRRRFRFEEMMPDSGVLRAVLSREVADPALVELTCDLLDTLNARIRLLYDRDHQVGHAYFLGVRSLRGLRDVFADRVIPLLQEYFYGAWDKVCLVLGCPYDEDGRPRRGGPSVAGGVYTAPLIEARRQDEVSLLGFDHEDLEPDLDFEVTAAFRPAPVGQERPSDKLVEALLGVLHLDAAGWSERHAALTAGGEA